MKDKDLLLAHFEQLDTLAKQVEKTVFSSKRSLSKFVDIALAAQWKSRALTLLQGVMPNNEFTAKQLSLFLKETSRYSDFMRLAGIFRGAYDDFKAGMFDNLKLEIESSVSCDFLGQANALLNDGEQVDYSYLPAAVLIGAVLEKTLRSLCENANPKIETVNENGRAKKMSAMIEDLKKAGVVNEIRKRQLETWNAIRNSAAHGKLDEFTKEQVSTMLQGVQDFMAQQMK